MPVFKHKTSFLTLILLLFASTATLHAQETVAVGQVISASSKRPIADVNVFFKNTDNGVKTDKSGFFYIRTTDKNTKLVISCIGYEKKEIRLKRGQKIGLTVKLNEKNTLLEEVFVVPGMNPALDLMKKVRILRHVNDIMNQTGYQADATSQHLVYLDKVNRHNVGKRIYKQLLNDNISGIDSTLAVPLYMDQRKIQIAGNQRKTDSIKVFSTSKEAGKTIQMLLGSTDIKVDFYENTFNIFNKSFISPLASGGSLYYKYFLTDSVDTPQGKQYYIRFISKNLKNLAFIGNMQIDSTTLALTYINAQLPLKANINFIHRLKISQRFNHTPNGKWSPENDTIMLDMDYVLLADSLHPKPRIVLKHTTEYNPVGSTTTIKGNFAASNMTEQTLDTKMAKLNNTPIMKTARWIADAALTGYMNVGKIDIGKIQNIARYTDLEGLRLNLPLRTNENLWKNVTVGGYLGYATRIKTFKYSAMAGFRLPGKLKRTISASYTNDYRRIDYNYNDYIMRELPLVSGDQDISSTILSLQTGSRMGERHEMNLTAFNDWNKNFESRLVFRYNQLFSNNWLPLQNATETYSSLNVKSATLVNRFSFHEIKIDDQLNRIYVSNYYPVIYTILEGGEFNLGNTTGKYGKVSATVKQSIKLNVGQFTYLVEAGKIFGKVPYPLLAIPAGNMTGGYGLYTYNMMNYMEFAADQYINLHGELTLNGIILNQIPLIKYLNLREMASFNFTYGSLNNASYVDLPNFTSPLSKPYGEIGIGVTNILRILSIQSVWRLTPDDNPAAAKWGIRACLSITF